MSTIPEPFTISRYLQQNRQRIASAARKDFFTPAPALRCADGFTVSVQASSGHSCTPRRDDVPVWTHVECAYPSEPVAEWLDYAEDRDKPTDTVYRRVPVDLVEETLIAHGGVVGTA